MILCTVFACSSLGMACPFKSFCAVMALSGGVLLGSEAVSDYLIRFGIKRENGSWKPMAVLTLLALHGGLFYYMLLSPSAKKI